MFQRDPQDTLRQRPLAAFEPRNRSWMCPSGLQFGALAKRDNAAATSSVRSAGSRRRSAKFAKACSQPIEDCFKAGMHSAYPGDDLASPVEVRLFALSRPTRRG